LLFGQHIQIFLFQPLEELQRVVLSDVESLGYLLPVDEELALLSHNLT
jgi:hypothetical protein